MFVFHKNNSSFLKFYFLTCCTCQVPNWWWGRAGPYRFEVRAIDPAGNKDPLLERGRNAYKWMYIPPTPVELILGITFGTIFLGVRE